MISVIASIQIKPGTRREFLEIFKANVPSVRQEIGCIEYFPAVDVKAELPKQVYSENFVTVIEKWTTVTALRDHHDSPHMHTYRKKVEHMVEDLKLRVVEEVEVQTEKKAGSVEKEYLDASENFRHYSNLRFAIFTIYLAVMAGLGSVAFKSDSSVPSYVLVVARIGGLLMTFAFWHYEEQAFQLLKHFHKQAKFLEGSLRYMQFKEMPECGNL